MTWGVAVLQDFGLRLLSREAHNGERLRRPREFTPRGRPKSDACGQVWGNSFPNEWPIRSAPEHTRSGHRWTRQKPSSTLFSGCPAVKILAHAVNLPIYEIRFATLLEERCKYKDVQREVQSNLVVRTSKNRSPGASHSMILF